MAGIDFNKMEKCAGRKPYTKAKSGYLTVVKLQVVDFFVFFSFSIFSKFSEM